MENIDYDTMATIFHKIAEEYYHLKLEHKKQLEDDYNIDSGTDYAKYILHDICYDEDGASIY